MSETGFDKQIGKTLGFEGGYVNDADDPGGETNFGITRRSYPDVNIQALTRADAIAIYRRDFWKKPGLARLPDTIGAKVFDLGVNMGQRTSIKLLQKALNRLRPFDEIDEDGKLGDDTLNAVAQVAEDELLNTLRAEAQRRYQHIIDAHPSMAKFRAGWMRRAAS